jgi:HEAT repeat protein
VGNKHKTNSEYKDARSHYKYRPTPRTDPRPTETLIQIALATEDEDEEYDLIRILQDRGTREVLEAARTLCMSSDPDERELGVDILAQGVIANKTLPEESLLILLDLLECEQDDHMLYSIACALGHHGDPRAITPLVRLTQYPDAEVREGVVFGLLTHEDPRAIAALIKLSDDTASQVRNWATFGLGTMVEVDTSALRDALYARVNDLNDEVRGEALVGLALRGDSRVVTPLLEVLAADEDTIDRLCIEALTEAGKRIKDRRLYPALMQLQEWKLAEYQEDDLEEAMKQCWKLLL